MKLKGQQRFIGIHSEGKTLRLFFFPAWKPKQKHMFTMVINDTTIHLGGREAKQLHTFLNRVF